jgi:hypothetical protein
MGRMGLNEKFVGYTILVEKFEKTWPFEKLGRGSRIILK